VEVRGVPHVPKTAFFFLGALVLSFLLFGVILKFPWLVVLFLCLTGSSIFCMVLPTNVTQAGIFEVYGTGGLVLYSKGMTGRFPREDELLQIIMSHASS
jgi:hypothetical protein